MRSIAGFILAGCWMCCSIPDQVLAQKENLVIRHYTMKDGLTAQTLVPESNYRFEHFNTDDGLPSEFVWSIAQDSLGFIWIQYYAGLTRYDGYTFKVYKHDAKDTIRSLPRGNIGRVVTDRSGNIWFKDHTPTRDFPITKYDRRRDAFIKYDPDLKGATVNGFHFDKTSPLIWFATADKGLLSFHPETLETKSYLNSQPDSIERVLSNTIYDISDRDSVLLLATGKGLWFFHKAKKTFSRPKCDVSNFALIHDAAIWSINDNDSELWLVLAEELVKVNEVYSVVQRLVFPYGFQLKGYDQSFKLTYSRDNEGVFWLATRDKGLYRYDPGNGSFINITNAPDDPYSIRSNNLNDIIVDKEQNVWVATHRGVSRLKKQSVHAYNYSLSAGLLDASTVYQANGKDYVIINSKKNNTDHDLMMAPIVSGRFDALQFQTLTSIKGIVVYGFWKGKRHFWISSYGEGVIGLPINSQTGMIEPGPSLTINHNPKNPNSISSNLTLGIWEDPAGNLWVCTRGQGLNKVVTDVPYGSKGSVTRYNQINDDPTSISNDLVHDIYPEDDESFWVLTDEGMDLLRNGRFHRVFKKKHTAFSFHKSADGILSVGGFGGLYEGTMNSDGYIFKKAPFIIDEDIVAIQEDKLGRLWLSSTKGIVCYDRGKQTVIAFNEMDGFAHTRAINVRQRIYQTSKGIIVIADPDGICLFDPLSLKINREQTIPVLTSLTVNNQVPVIGSKASAKGEFAVSSDITILDQLVLDYRHNNFSIEFSAMQQNSPEKNRYRHKLEGYDNDWIETDWRNRNATYTNLDAGNYIFKVRASNHHGIWSDQETALAVRILPPPWKTWWAYSLYGLAFIGAILSWRQYDIKRVKLRHRAEHLSELDKLKSRFFANISHEFRTPITLILGPLKDLYNGKSKEDPKALLGPVIRNGQRLHRLINQLLDLSKIEAGKMRLHVSAIELVEFLRDIASSYESLATEKKIKYVFYPEAQELIAYIDPEKIEKVVHNLLSNAFKFTKPGGEVILNLKAEKTNCLVTVKDTGIGIPENQLDKVFDRFYQVDSSQTRGYEGSGLGMALAKDLVELHRGKISVHSTKGKGTTFTVSLPLGKEHLNNEEISDTPYTSEREILSDLVVSGENGEEETATAQGDGHPVLLIVEDNADMRNYIRKTLSGQYNILEAENGKDGVSIAEETLPDLIISDIMMPEMDGFKLCSLIKNNEVTSHIPVILLTAKADRESKLSGLETGADDYLSKPFDADELKLIVRNRIEERRKMRERFSREITLEPTQISITSLDEKFLARVLAIIEARMDDEHFSIEELSREAGFSNMHFYRKIKALTDQTPSQFLRTIRLKRAAEMLAKSSDNVTQIAYAVGFSSLSYFNKCFKEQFGMTPGEYSQEHMNAAG